MRIILFAFLFLTSFGCTDKTPDQSTSDIETEPQLIEKPSFKGILDSATVKGAILIYSPSEDTYYSNDFDWSKEGSLPASTFKIANSIIGLETGVVESDSTLFKWDGQERGLKIWEQDLIFKDAFHYSCVPCYQQVARGIGAERMQAFLAKLDYGDIKLDASDIDRFWLEGDSKISPFQQIDFLSRFYNKELPISERTFNIMKKMMVIEEHSSYKISGKTGWAIRNGKNRGWFVGYLESNNQTHFFATNIIPQEAFNMDLFPRIRKEITHAALQEMGLLP